MKVLWQITACFTLLIVPLVAQSGSLAEIFVQENAGIERVEEYVTCAVQLSSGLFDADRSRLVVTEKSSDKSTYCQVLENTLASDGSLRQVRIVFPVMIGAGERKLYQLHQVKGLSVPESDLHLSGEHFDRVIENDFYRVDLSKNEKIEPQSYDSGQIREIFVKMGFDQLLTNAEDRVHWAPNFKRPEIEWYTTIAHWQAPAFYQVRSGPYVIETKRRGPAPQHPEINLTAVYTFYARQPWFRFFSRMEMTDDVWLELLRNDEMTMDSMFTHLAFERPDGQVVDVAFADRFDVLKQQPIENEAPWISFYNAAMGMAFGSVRLRYDIANQFGEDSPVYRPHTQIGEWLAGIKYWNRRLIHDHLTFVPQGSRYSEENIYLIFRTGKEDKFAAIRKLVVRMKNPLMAQVEYGAADN